MSKTALILAPHPDDECITGLLPLRLREECGFRIRVVPVTWGSCVERRPARKREMKAACVRLNFTLNALESPLGSAALIRELAARFEEWAPSVVILPHRKDGHPVHQAVHRLGVASMDRFQNRRFHVGGAN